jgi:hypothetical protein
MKEATVLRRVREASIPGQTETARITIYLATPLVLENAGKDCCHRQKRGSAAANLSDDRTIVLTGKDCSLDQPDPAGCRVKEVAMAVLEIAADGAQFVTTHQGIGT